MADINKRICNYIAKEWIAKAKSNRAFATEHYIDEKTVRKILKPEGYRMPVKTLEKICEAREIKISYFFSLIGA
ncbi:transcriptional regulator [Aquimarina mytili]|uniref:Transcriptional regulator n=1 Tax=Aquimarina mytili TaxID=874423 RepID=A0A936ZYA5_9FLAO|nr:transcriptional regulator [Aquimarina mytili]MBL0684120.1 transcriptional regulator [Aquimarina mytili]